MKILHLTSTFWPDYTGGKEVFVHQLIKSTPESDHRVLLHGNAKSSYEYDGIHVYVLPEPITSNPRLSYFDMTYDGIPGFADVLDSFRPDIVHFHDFAGSASLTHFEICKSRGAKTMLTYHSPGQSCLQRALIYGGQRPCNGLIDVTTCAKCRYVVAGMSPTVASVFANIRQPFPALNKFFQAGNVAVYKKSWQKFHYGMDVIQIHAHWVKDLLTINGVNENNIRFVEMGGTSSLPKTTRRPGKRLTFAFIGRCYDVKGVHLFLDALKMFPADADFEVHFFGPFWDDEYGQQMRAKIGGDKRFLEPRLLPHHEVVSQLTNIDICVIPSLWPETGPFTVFDAFAANAVIVGTNHAGIGEKVHDGRDGLLFEWGDTNGLYARLKELFDDRNKLERLRNNIVPNRTFSDFGISMNKLYLDLVPHGN